MSYNRKVISCYPSCYREIAFKYNCNLEECCNLIFDDVDIYEAECIKVINKKIVDYITVKDFKYRVEEKGEFKIVNSFDYKHNQNDSIFIDKIFPHQLLKLIFRKELIICLHHQSHFQF